MLKTDKWGKDIHTPINKIYRIAKMLDVRQRCKALTTLCELITFIDDKIKENNLDFKFEDDLCKTLLDIDMNELLKQIMHSAIETAKSKQKLIDAAENPQGK
jgi:hypothetical protein